MKRYLLIFAFTLFSGLCFGQVIGTNIDACGGTFTDTGGTGGNYGNSQNLTSTICPDAAGIAAGQVICLDFTAFSLEDGFDFLTIYNDDAATAPNLFSSATGTELNGTKVCASITADNPDGCLTFVFDSDGGVSALGWTAAINCVTPCIDPTAALAPTTTTVVCPPSAENPGMAVDFDGSGSTAAAGYNLSTYDWDFGDGTTTSTATATTSHTYTTPGVYLASLSVRDDNTDIDALGCQSSNAATTIVIASPPPDFTGTSTVVNVSCGESANLSGAVQSQQVIQEPPPVTIAPVALPDGTGAAYEVPLDYTGIFPQGATVDANCTPIFCLNLEHSWKNDLTIDLVSPNGTIVRVMSRSGSDVDFGNCVNGNDLLIPGCTAEYCFAEAGPDIDGVTLIDPPDGGSGTSCAYTGSCEGDDSYVPAGTYGTENSFTAFNGDDLNGVWIILVTDNASSDDGSIDGASLSFPTSCYSPLLADNPDITTTSWAAVGTAPATPAETPASVAYTDANTLCTNASPADGCDGNMVTNDITVGPFNTPGTYDYTFSATDVNGCEYEETVQVVVADNCPVPCPELQTATSTPDGCDGDMVTLTATVDMGVENVDYFLQWFEDGVAIPGANSLGGDGEIGTNDDQSVLTYMHALSNTNGACNFTDHEYHVEIYCINQVTLDLGTIGDATNTNAGSCLVGTYRAPCSSVGNLDLTGLPSCAELLGFDYGVTFSSGGGFGDSYICEALLQVDAPDGLQGPFCSGELSSENGGTCPSAGTGSFFDSTCDSFSPEAGAGVNTLSDAFIYTFVPGTGTGVLAAYDYDITVCDSYEDNDGDPEGCVNYLFLDVKYYLPPTCDANPDGILVATSSSTLATTPNNGGTSDPGGADAGALSGVRACDVPVLATDFTVPTGCEDFAVTDLCGNLSIGYATTAAGPFDHTLTDASTLVTPADGDEVFYEIFIDIDGNGVSDCPACATVTGSWELTGCCPTATLATAPMDACHAGTTDVCYTFSGDAEGVTMTVNGVSATCTGCGTGPLCVTLTADNTTCAVETVPALVTMLCPDGNTNVTAGGVALDGSAAATAGDFDEYPDPTNFAITVTPSAGCGLAPTITDGTCNTITAQGWMSGNALVDGCTTFATPPTTETYSWTQTPPAFAVDAPVGCTYPNASNMEMVTGCEECNDCPTATAVAGTQDVCTGGDADLSDATTGFAIATDADGTAGNVVWTNDGAAPLVDGSNVTTATGLTNITCDMTDITLNAWLECDGNQDGFIQGAAAADDSYIAAGSITVNIYPNANAFTVNEIEGSCGVAASVEILAEDDTSSCFAMTGTAPNDPGCGAADDVQDLTYNFDPAFPAACNLTFGNTLAASCSGGELPIPTLTCPPTTLNRCNGDPYNCMFSDQNPDTAAETEANPIIGGPDAGVVGTDGIIDPQALAAGSYTFTLTYTTLAGCSATTTCTFNVAEPAKGANAGSLNGN